MDRNQNQELASNQVPVLFLNTKKKKKKNKQTNKQTNSETRTKQLISLKWCMQELDNIQNQICKPLQYSSTVTGKDCFLICFPVSF